MEPQRLTLRERVGRWVGGFNVSYADAASGAYLLETGERPAHLRRPVTPTLASQQAVVFACVNLLSASLSLMPFKVVRNYRAEVNDPVARLWNGRPNIYHTGPDLMRWIAQCVLYHGNCYFEIVRNRLGEVLSLDPLPPWHVQVRLKGNKLVYDVWNSPAMVGRGTPDRTLKAERVLHLRGLHLIGGVVGVSPIQAGARGPVNSSFLAEEYAADTFMHGWHSPIITGMADNKPGRGESSVDARRRSMAAAASTYTSGTSSRQRPFFASSNAKVEWPSLTAEDQQMLESQKWSGERICGCFGIMPPLVGFETKSPVAALVQQIMAIHRTVAVQPYAVSWAAEIYDKLLRNERDTSCYFDPDELTRGDRRSRYEGHKVALGGTGQKGFKSVNDVRREERLPPKGDPDDPDNPYEQVSLAMSGAEADKILDEMAAESDAMGQPSDEELLAMLEERGLLTGVATAG